MKPLKDYILVTEKEAETQTASGLILAGAAETGSKPAIVKAIGPDVESVAIGDVIAINWSDGLPVTVQGIKAVLVSEEVVRGIY
jgi:co-chaperonin GroES (HSP10)